MRRIVPWLPLVVSGILIIAFVAWVAALVPTGPASSPIALVYEPRTPAHPEQLTQGMPATPVRRLLFAGDIMQHRNQAGDDFNSSYAEIRSLIRDADLAMANLEFPVFPDRPVGPEIGSTRFNGSPSHLTALHESGFDVLVTSNNHAFDQGLEGLYRTIEEVKSAGMLPVGTARSLEQLLRFSPLDMGPIQIAIVAYTYSVNPIREGPELIFPPRETPIFSFHFSDWQGVWRSLGKQAFLRHSRGAREAGANFVIAYCHWGKEWHFQATEDQRLVAHDLIDAGFDLVVGSHGHVLQGTEIYKGKLIVYSLGSLISDFRPWQTRTSALLQVDVAVDEQPAAVGFRFFPTFTELKGHRVTLLSKHEEGVRARARELAERVLGDAVADVR